MNSKRIGITTMAGILMLSNTVALATNPTYQETPVNYIGIGNQVYEVSVPSLLEPSQSGEVKLWGTWDSTKLIEVSTDNKITVTNSIDNKTKELDIEFNKISKEGNNTTPIEITENIKVGDITDALFGTWTGNITYNINFKNIENIVIENDRYQLLGTDTMEIPVNTMYGSSLEVENSDDTIADVELQTGKLVVTPKKEGVTTIKLKSSGGNDIVDTVKEFKIDVSHNYVQGTCTRCGEKDITSLPAGLYNSNWQMTRSWDDLIANGIVYNNDGVIKTNHYWSESTGHINSSNSYLNSMLIIPEGVTELGVYAFGACDNLTGLVIPSTLQTVGINSLYSESSKLVTLIVNPNNKYFKTVNGILYDINMETIVKYPANKTATSFTIPSSVRVVGSSSFMSNKYIKSVVIPEGATSIETTAFSTCLNLSSVSMPDSIKLIDRWAFGSCPLYSITLPSNLEKLGDGAFGHTKLTKVWIPKSCKTITNYCGSRGYNSAFIGVPSNCKIYCEVSSKPTGWSDYFNCYADTWNSNSYKLPTYWNITREQFNELP